MHSPINNSVSIETVMEQPAPRLLHAARGSVANKNMKEKPYKARSLKSAQAMVRNHRKQIADCHALIERLAHERKLLAKLAAKTPQFFNPLEAMAAETIRDSILKPLNDEAQPRRADDARLG